jgi:hypothetical protein
MVTGPTLTLSVIWAIMHLPFLFFWGPSTRWISASRMPAVITFTRDRGEPFSLAPATSRFVRAEEGTAEALS